MRATLVVLLVTMSMLPLGYMVYPPALADNITIEKDTFGNGEKEAVVEFGGAGSDSTYDLSIQEGLFIDDVKLKVSSVAQPLGDKNYPSNISIDFGNDNMLEWAWRGPGYGQLGRQTTFINDQTYMNASVPRGGGSNNTVAIRLPKTADVKSASLNVSAGSRIGTQGKLLVLYAMYQYYGWPDNVISKMRAFSNDFNTVDGFDAGGGTPEWDDIKDYGEILVFSDVWYGYPFRDAKTLGDLLADYVDAGGALVVAETAFYAYSNYYITGRFLSDNYYAIPAVQSLTTSSSGVGQTLIAGHPVMQNVTSISFPYYGWTYRMYTQNAAQGAEIISKWADGYVMAAQKNVNGVDRVDINMWPVEYSASGMYGSYPALAYYGDGDDLLKNALLYAGRKTIDFKVDVLDDASIELDETAAQGNYTLTDFSSMLNDYLSTHEATYTDAYGNAFVDVPINVSSPSVTGGRLQFNKLNILYDYTTSIEPNPQTGNLTLSISDLQSTVQSQNMNSIPIYITSSSAGTLRLHDLYMRMTPPIHSPKIISFSPAATTAVKENSSQDMVVKAIDWYGNPISYKWYYDDVLIEGATENTTKLSFDFQSEGDHTAMVEVSNGISANTFTKMTWNLKVQNVNRGPVIKGFLPLADPTINENETQQFSVNASDPDGETLGYAWFLDGKLVPGATAAAYSYISNFLSSGDHAVKVVVSDPNNATAFKSWKVTVKNVNVPPAITDFSPRTNPTLTETQSWTFSVTTADPDKSQSTGVSWFVDDSPAFIGNPFTYETDYNSAGEHKVRADVSDGEQTASKVWDVTVLNLNRLPQPVIDSPQEGTEFMQYQAIHFSAASSWDPDNETMTYSWKEGEINLSDLQEFDRDLSPGIHAITLEVRDASGGVAATTVRIRVRYIELKAVVGLDRFEVVAGDKVDVIVTMSNIGDANATDLVLEVSVDGKSLGTQPISLLRAGGADRQIFKWTAQKGLHNITASIGGTTLGTKEVTVEDAPAPEAGPGLSAYIWPIMIVVVIVVLVAFGAMALRKK